MNKLVFSWFLHLHRWHREWDRKKGGYVPALSIWSMRHAYPPPGRLGDLSAAMCAAGKWARCTSHLPLRGAVNYNPICSTNCCSPECRIPCWLQYSQKGQLSRPRISDRRHVHGRQTYRPTAATWSCGRWAGPCAEMATTAATALLGKGLGASGDHRPHSHNLVVTFFACIKKEARWQLWFKLMKVVVRRRVKEWQDADCHNWACVVADLRQAFSFLVVTSVVKQPRFLA